MKKVKCDGCGRVIKDSFSKIFTGSNCSSCGGSFEPCGGFEPLTEEIEAKDGDDEEMEEDQEDNEEEYDKAKCPICREEIDSIKIKHLKNANTDRDESIDARVCPKCDVILGIIDY